MNCNCPIWASGRIHGKLFRRSLGTRNRQVAREKINELLGQPSDAPTPPEEPAKASPTVANAIAEYLGFCECNKRLKASTLTSYRNTLSIFAEFCERRLYRTVGQFNLRLFEDFQSERGDRTPKTVVKDFTHLAGLCDRLGELGFLSTNFAKKIKLPKTDGVSTLPFKKAEVEALLVACAKLGQTKHPNSEYARYSAEQLHEERCYARALLMTLLATGFRVSDVAGLTRAKIFVDRRGATRVRVKTQKTGTVLTLRLPPVAAEALRNLPTSDSGFFFSRGPSDTQITSACHRVRRVITRLGKLAGVKGAAPHRFRDTWAKEALVNGTSLRTIQLVLGHASIRTTEAHYLPFVSEYQDMIDEATDGVAEKLLA